MGIGTPNLQDLESLFNLSVDLLCITSSDSTLVTVNPTFMSSLGFSEEELIGKPFLSLVHPDELEHTIAELGNLTNGRTTLLFENRLLTASGEVRSFQWCARADAATGRIYASGRDVTHQNLDRERLQRYSNLLEGAQSELKQALDELTRIANADQLTGLLNRRGFEVSLMEEISRSTRNQQPIGLAMFDIDHFKLINDEHGHPTGDVVLREIARRIETGHRPYDIAARWGGEEFMVIFPNSDLEATLAAAERIALSIAVRPVIIGASVLNVRVSGGVTSCLGSEVVSAAEFIAVADSALLQAKANGRDRIEALETPALRLAS